MAQNSANCQDEPGADVADLSLEPFIPHVEAGIVQFLEQSDIAGNGGQFPGKEIACRLQLSAVKAGGRLR